MANFNTNLKLGQTAYVVTGPSLDPVVQAFTVAQVRVQRTHPDYNYADEPRYKEEYMCLETGVGSGTLWLYGRHIFSCKADAEAEVKKRKQRAFKEIKKRDEDLAKEKEWQRRKDLETLSMLKAKYEN